MPERDRADLVFLLAVAARSLVVIFMVGLLAQLLPPALFDPVWQMRFCIALVTQAPLALLGLILLHAAAGLAPGDGRLLAARQRWRSLAVGAALGFVLLLPLQGLATWRGFAHIQQLQAKQRSQAEARFQAMQRAIDDADSVLDLQTRMQAVSGPLLTPADLALPLPQLRRQLDANLQAARSRVLDRLHGPSSAQLGAMLQDAVRLPLSALALAAGFAGCAQRRQSPIPLLLEWSDALRSWRGLRLLKLGMHQRRSPQIESELYLREIQSRDL